MESHMNNIWEGIESDFFTKYGGDDDIFTSMFETDGELGGGLSRQILNILFVIDVSGSMRGARIAQVNYAMENIVKEMRNREDLNSVIKIGIMEFADQANWITPKPVLAEDYVFTPIQAQQWVTFYKSAFLALEKKLHKAEFMNPDLGEYFAPLILFITDGEPVDVEEYPAALEKLKQNKWFKKAAKYAIAVGEEAKSSEVTRILAQFTGEKNNVRYADEGEALCDLIEFIAVRASEVQTSVVDSRGDGNSIFDKPDNSLWSSMFDSKY